MLYSLGQQYIAKSADFGNVGMLIFLQVTENHCARDRCPTHSTVKIRIVQDCAAVSAIAESLFKLMCILLNVLIVD